MSAAPLVVAREAATAVITLSRPNRLNALSHELLVELSEHLRELDASRDVRAIVLTGAGRAFSSGADLRNGPSDAEHVLRTYYNPLITQMLALRTPLIAAVNGVAAGAAVALALACDLRVAGVSASFQLSFVKVGLVPDAGTTWLLPRAVGSTRAAEMALTGRPVGAHEAARWGLINELVVDKQVLPRAMELADGLAALSSSVATTRALLHAGWHRRLDEQLDAEASCQGVAQYGADYLEARAAFAERRPPQFVPAVNDR